MAVTLTTVTGTLELPDGTTPHLGRVIFTMAGWAKTSPELFVNGSVDVPAASNGTFSVALQTTEDLGVEYDVVFSHFDLARNKEVRTAVGRITVPSSGPVTLASLLPVRLPNGAGASYEHKRGDTLNIAVQMLDETGRPLSLTGSSAASALKGPDGVVRSLSVAVINAASGWLEVAMSALETADLPLGPHVWDIRVTTGSVVRSTPSATITMIDEVTQ